MKKIIALTSAAILTLVLGIFFFTGALGGEAYERPLCVTAFALEAHDLEIPLSLTGIVYSAQSNEVHSTLHFPVDAVNVRVGDRVSEGDVLAVLDMSTMEMEARRLQAGLSAAQAAANQNLTAARNALETAQRNVEAGYDPALMTARFGVSSAQLAVESADAQVTTAGQALNNARQDLRDYRSEMRFRGDDFDRYDDFDPVLSQLRGAVIAAEGALRGARSGLELAEENLRIAEESYAAAQILSGDLLSAHEDMVSAAQVSTNFNDMQIAIQQLHEELEKAEILSPVSGTVTAVLAEEGALGIGLLFVIQDADNLIVKTNIRELDIAFVTLGDRVEIRADATGNAVFAGSLTRIAPTSIQMAHGTGQHSAYAEFESEVAVPLGSGLRIGMNARLSIATRQRTDVLAVPAHAITTNAQGERMIFIAASGDDGHIAEAITVTTGMQTQQLVEVAADELTVGALVIADAAGLRDGMLVAPQEQG